jgi:hypothetical protein
LISATALTIYRRLMQTTTNPTRSMPNPTPHRGPAPLGLGAAGLLLAAALAACSSAASTFAPSGSAALPSLALPSGAASAIASAVSSAGTQVALDALDKVDSAISANKAAAGLSADDVSALETLTASIRTALQTGDLTAARAAVDQLSTKVGGMSSMLSTDAGKQLSEAVSALKSALATG